MLAERFHASPALLQRLNPRTPIAADRDLRVPDVQPFDPDRKPAFDPMARVRTVSVSKEESALRVSGADGTLIFFAPVTTGGQYDPLPIGDWKVTGVDWHPAFHYNPKLFWDAKPEDSKATIKPGPNNPVGVAWIALNLEHYGLHGSPEPGHMTNRVARMRAAHELGRGACRLVGATRRHACSSGEARASPRRPVTFAIPVFVGFFVAGMIAGWWLRGGPPQPRIARTSPRCRRRLHPSPKSRIGPRARRRCFRERRPFLRGTRAVR